MATFFVGSNTPQFDKTITDMVGNLKRDRLIVPSTPEHQMGVFDSAGDWVLDQYGSAHDMIFKEGAREFKRQAMMGVPIAAAGIESLVGHIPLVGQAIQASGVISGFGANLVQQAIFDLEFDVPAMQ